MVERQGKLEVVNAEFDEGLYLLDDLLRSADEGIFSSDVVGIESLQFGLVFDAETASEPGTAQGGRIAPNFVAGAFAFGNQLAIGFDAFPTDVPPVGMASNEAQHPWPGTSDHDGRERIGFRFAICLDDLVMFAVIRRVGCLPGGDQ